MEHYEDRTEPARTFKKLVKTTCDLCGEEIRHRCRSQYDVDEAKIELRNGSAYPEGSNCEYTECDICGACFEEKLVPWLEAQGVKMRKRDGGY